MSKYWPRQDKFFGYVTTLDTVSDASTTEIERRLGYRQNSLSDGYALYKLTDDVGRHDFSWKGDTIAKDGWAKDEDAIFGADANGRPQKWRVPVASLLRAELGRQLNYNEPMVDDAIAKKLEVEWCKLRVKDGPKQIVKVRPVKSLTKDEDFVDAYRAGFPQWRLLEPGKKFRLLEVVPSESEQKLMSGKDWWHANQASYPNSAGVGELDAGFRTKVEDFLKALAMANATVTVAATRRNATRAYLMHWSFKLANGNVQAKNINPSPDCAITWDHGDEEKSRAAAKEMVDLFDIVYQPSLTSLHIKGLAIDMNISWVGTMSIVDGKGVTREIGAPANGASNAALHKVGATYGVTKLLSDKPHWSSNGH